MLDEIDSHHLFEWIAFEQYEDEVIQRGALQADAQAAVDALKRRPQ